MRELRDSGNERFGCVPYDWEIVKTKYVANLYTGNSIKDEEKDLFTDSNDAIPYIATKDIEQDFNLINYDNGLYVKNSDNSFARAYSGSTLMCIEGGSAGRKKALLDRTVCFVNKLCCFSSKDINPKYLYYYLNSPQYEDEFKQNISGLIGGVSKSVLANIIMLRPPKKEQERIVCFLDSKCQQIDTIVSKQKQIIEKLKEYKTLIITEAVTKGIVSDAEMKESGIEWVGTVPADWKAQKLGAICNRGITYGIVKMGDYDEDGIKALRCSDVQAGYIDESNIRTVTKEVSDAYSRTVLQGGEVVINVRGTLGGCAVVPMTMKGYNIAREVAMVAVSEAVPRYVMYNLLSLAFKAYQEYCLRGVIYVGLNINLLNKYVIFLPDIEEQQHIVEYLDSRCNEIDESIRKRESIIEKLQEYKKSLIFDVVTGKKEV